MRKSKILLTMSALILTLGLVGCGQEKEPTPDTTIDEVVESTTPEVEIETPEVENPEEDSNTEETGIVVSDYIDYKLVDGILTVKLLSDTYVWDYYTYDMPNVNVEVNEDAPYMIYTITGVEAGNEIPFDIIGTFGSTQLSSIMTLTVTEDLKVEYSYEELVVDIETPTVEEITIDEDLNAITQSALTGLGDTVYLDALATRPLNMEDTYDMDYCLGTSTLTGLESGAVTEPMMSSNAFSLIVLKFDSNENATAAKESLLKTAPIEKWICVIPDDTRTVVVKDTYVVFLMGSMDQINAFDNITF